MSQLPTIPENLPPEVAAFFKTRMGSDFESVLESDFKIPVLRLLESKSTEVENETHKRGQVIDNFTGRLYVTDPETDFFEFIPIYQFRGRIRFAPIGSAEKVLCRSNNYMIGVGDPGGECLTCEYQDWDKADGKPECSDVMNYFLYANIDDSWEIVQWSTKRTGLRCSVQFHKMMQGLTAQSRIFCWKFRLGVAKDKGRGTTFYNWELKKRENGHFEEQVTDAQLLMECDKWNKVLYDLRLQGRFDVHSDQPAKTPEVNLKLKDLDVG